MGIIIRKYADLTTPTPAYGGKVWHAFSPKAWVHVLVDINTGKLERLDGVTGILKKAVDKSQPLMRWAVKLALARAREKRFLLQALAAMARFNYSLKSWTRYSRMRNEQTRTP